jgi:hypothetical protein
MRGDSIEKLTLSLSIFKHLVKDTLALATEKEKE